MYSNIAVKVLSKKSKVLSPFCKSKKKFNKRLLGISSQKRAILARAVFQSEGGESRNEACKMEFTLPFLRFTDGIKNFFQTNIKNFEVQELLTFLIEVYAKLDLEYHEKKGGKSQVTNEEEDDETGALNSSLESNSSDKEHVKSSLEFLRGIQANINMSGGDSFLTNKEKDDLKDLVIRVAEVEFRRLFQIFLSLHQVFREMLF